MILFDSQLIIFVNQFYEEYYKNIIPFCMNKIIFSCLLTLLVTTSFAVDSKQIHAVRSTEPIKIDGVLSEPIWETLTPATGFVQAVPNPNSKPHFDSEVKVTYDDVAIYIGAMLYDAHPDSILKELGTRDAGENNADLFGVQLDTYNDKQNAFEFVSSASGVQTDIRHSNNDPDQNWNAVWYNAVKITDKGWVVEMKIPYSAIRFADKPEQTWGINFIRVLRRYREKSYWSAIDPAKPGFVNQFGLLNGIKEVKPPLRLMFFPYISYYAIHDGNTNTWSHTPRGGADVKYGINESFTLDMTLVPDFGQVQSDNIVYNLTPYEVRFDDFRPFFTEGTELFNKDDLFYSRRIGGRPMNYYNVEDELKAGEYIVSNPTSSQLLNSTKISGRTKGNLGIGFINSITKPTFARVADSLGNERKIETDPLTNYNMLVLDQPFWKNSFISLINTNVMREGNAPDANVTALMTKITDKKNAYAFTGNAKLSQLFGVATDKYNTMGYAYNVAVGKYSGNLNFEIARSVLSNKYDQNDLGYLAVNNFISNTANITLQQYKPKYGINRSRISVGAEYKQHFATKDYMAVKISMNSFLLTKNFWAYGLEGEYIPFPVHDYFATRTENKFVRLSNGAWLNGWISTNYVKKLAVDAYYGHFSGFGYQQYTQSDWIGFTPRYRVNNRLTFKYNLDFEMPRNEIGWAAMDYDNAPIFGKRDVRTVNNVFTTTYNFTRRMALSFRLRHYSLTTKYKEYYHLQENGNWTPYPDYQESQDLSFNAFNIDLVYNWEFTAGSQLSVVWKNAISDFNGQYTPSYFSTWRNTFDAPQTNSLSVKIVYFLDSRFLAKKNV